MRIAVGRAGERISAAGEAVSSTAGVNLDDRSRGEQRLGGFRQILDFQAAERGQQGHVFDQGEPDPAGLRDFPAIRENAEITN